MISTEMASAETLHCPSCGAAAPADSTSCSYCNARLATVACPSCFGMMFVGEKFCSHCGAAGQRSDATGETALRCPHCKCEMKAVQVGKSTLRECSACEGMWLDVTTLQQICDDKEQQAAVAGMPITDPEAVHLDTRFRYIPCPVCGQFMNRINFARISAVVVDVCKKHGTWFDRDELRRLVEFIRGGGLEKSRARRNAELEEEARRLQASANAAIPSGMQAAVDAEWSGHRSDSGALAILDIVGWIFRLLR